MDPPLVLALGAEEGVASEPLLYVTTRTPRRGRVPYATEVGDDVRRGRAHVRLTPERLSLLEAIEHAAFPWHGLRDVEPLDTEPFAEHLDAALDATPGSDLVVYVHGTKVTFERPISRAAELQHFAGRRFATLAFDWPSHGNILAYVLGPDRRRAKEAAHPFAQMLDWLSTHSDAERIHVLAYSAGCEVVTLGLSELRERHADESPEELHERLRLANVVLCSGDVPVPEFLEHLPAIHDVARRVTVLLSDADNALQAAERFMGGPVRLGEEEAEHEIEAFLAQRPCPRLHLIDVSLGQEARGFDITGHHYWYRHPWVAADVLMLLLTDRDPEVRGLVRGPWHQVWTLPHDYPARLTEAARDAGLPVEPGSSAAQP